MNVQFTKMFYPFVYELTNLHVSLCRIWQYLWCLSSSVCYTGWLYTTRHLSGV